MKIIQDISVRPAFDYPIKDYVAFLTEGLVLHLWTNILRQQQRCLD